MKSFAIDFETYYDKLVNISTLGSHHYVRASDVYMVSIANDEFQWVGHPEEAPWDKLRGAHLVAHNMSFDGTVLKFLQERGLVPADVGAGGMDCTADLAAYFQRPRNLKGACETMLGGYQEIDKSMRDYMKGRFWYEVPPDMQRKMLDYAMQDSLACWELWETWGPEWPAVERKASRHTRELLWRGVRVDRDRLEKSIADLSVKVWQAKQEIPWVDDVSDEDLEGDKPLSRNAFNEQCRKHGLTPPASLAATDDEACLWFAENEAAHPWITAPTRLRRINALLKKVQAIKHRIREDGRMSVELKYFGAEATGRWSGAGGVNMQNLPRDEMFGVDMRSLFIPDEGRLFGISDLGQIEPRCGASMVGDEDLLNKVREGFPIYEAHARSTMGWSGGKLKDEDPDRYRLAKARILGLGYGAGGERFQGMAKILAGLVISREEADFQVRDFRDSNPKIVSAWRRIEKILTEAALAKEDCEFTLPSGRNIRYFSPECVGFGFNRKLIAATKQSGPSIRWWGSKVFENLIQGFARDVMRDCVLRVEKAGFPVAFHVHDEVIAQVGSEADAKELTRLMTTNPDWLPGVPLASESTTATHYLK